MPVNPTYRIDREEVSLRQRVVDRLRDLILMGTLAPGQKLVERSLCDNLGVSRTLLREALQQLQAEGLIVQVIHRGPSVAQITEQDAREIYEVRQMLESAAGHGFTLNATDAQIDELERNVAEFADAAKRTDPHELLAAKNKFYDTLLFGCGNTVISQLLRQLNNRVTILRRMSMARKGRLEQTVSELEGIVAAVRRRDADEAARLCAEHVQQAATYALAAFTEQAQRSVEPADAAPRSGKRKAPATPQDSH